MAIPVGTPIRPIFARKARTKGKVEKLIQYLQRDSLAEVRDRVHSFAQPNEQPARWVQHYNRRPHASLEYKSPASRYRVSLKPLAPELDEERSHTGTPATEYRRSVSEIMSGCTWSTARW